MKAKWVVIIVGCSLVCYWLAAAALSPWLQVQYHISLLQQAQSHIAVQDYNREIQKLLQIGYLERHEISFQNHVVTGTVRQAFVEEVRQSISTNEVWELNFSVNGRSVTVFCPATETAKWRKLVSDYDAR